MGAARTGKEEKVKEMMKMNEGCNKTNCNYDEFGCDPYWETCTECKKEFCIHGQNLKHGLALFHCPHCGHDQEYPRDVWDKTYNLILRRRYE